MAGGGAPRAAAGSLLRFRGDAPTASNVALGKPTRASSVLYPDNYAARATDGKFDSIFHSDTEAKPYLVVDLGAAFSIESVRVMPRLDFNSSRFMGVEVRTGLTQVQGPDFTSYTRLALFPGPAYLPTTWFTQNLTQPVAGRYVSVQRTAEPGGLLEITELEVFARQ
ncbi:uncharacterized protein LOC125177637 [Hyalella azteca]|uniref:Uncharacterized protein LOC125177637 n=1 Tax=Hyalella azteca TaxID=294128 RepID=A0A979FHE1_HYAAZ|nr:uncharacterized protein LOC125177637 [Hyalella azteca]